MRAIRRLIERSWLGQLLTNIHIDTAETRRAVLEIPTRLARLEKRMTSMEQTYGDQLGALIGVVVAEVASLQDGIRQKDAALQAAQQQLADADENTRRQVEDALAADSQADAARTKAWLDQLAQAAPVTVPAVPVPDPGQPAEPPADSGLDVPETPAPAEGDQPAT